MKEMEIGQIGKPSYMIGGWRRDPRIGGVGMVDIREKAEFRLARGTYMVPLFLVSRFKETQSASMKREIKTYTIKLTDLFSGKVVRELDNDIKAVDLMSKSKRKFFHNGEIRTLIKTITEQMYKEQTRGFENNITPKFKKRYKEWLTLVVVRMFNELPEE